MSKTFYVEPGEDWSLQLSAFDPDNDLQSIEIDFSGNTNDWLEFDQNSLTIYTLEDKSAQTLGSALITVVLVDAEENVSSYPVTLLVECSSGNRSELCYEAPEEDFTFTTGGSFSPTST